MISVFLCIMSVKNITLDLQKSRSLFTTKRNKNLIQCVFPDKEDDVPDAIRGLALVGKSAALASTYACQIWTAELYPTVVRNIGVAAGSVAARVATILAPQFVYWVCILTTKG